MSNPPLKLVYGKPFDRDVKRAKKSGKDMEKLFSVVELLSQCKPLPPQRRDHKLMGNYRSWRECHIEPDWLLIYKVEGDELLLARTGSHVDLFGW
jgi:mRNA interferase YafQ